MSLSASSVTSSSLVDRPLPRLGREVSLSSFSYLFSELVQYCQLKSESTSELEHELHTIGESIGWKYLELAALRQNTTNNSATNSSSLPASSSSFTRPRSLIQFLQFVHSVVWRQLFGHAADGLEKSTNSTDEFYLYESSPIPNRFISLINSASFTAGLLSGILSSANFPAEVQAHFAKEKTVYIMKFQKDVMKREKET
jgi:hypothetical protein